MNWWRNKRKTYKITFRKTKYNFKSPSFLIDGSWQEIADSAIIATVFEIANILNIKVISVNIQNSFSISTIKIRCSEENKIKFMKYFTKTLNNKIKDITF